MHIPERLLPLVEKLLDGTIEPGELEQLNDWYRRFEQTDIDLRQSNIQDAQQLSARIKQRLRQTIINGSIQDKDLVVPLYKKWRIPAAAAVLFLLIGMGAYFFYPTAPQPVIALQKPKAPAGDLLPGSKKAILILNNGEQIELDSANTGVLNQEAAATVEKTGKGSLVYTGSGQITPLAISYNTVATPRGGEYQVTLADGTKVWLNAASSIRFPTAFPGKERIVEITGEVYFEVAKNPLKPFKVISKGQTVEVLGTHFNVNTYDDEPEARTSLLEGAVRIIPGSTSAWKMAYELKPGNQARMLKSGRVQIVKDADLEEVMAWKNNLFIFNSTDLKTIMRQLARWYDVDIEYKGNADLRFTGQITRNNNVSKVFEKLKLTGEVDFTVVNQKIIVTRTK